MWIFKNFMSETFFISDTHFGHTNILEYEKEARPFNNITEMNETMITRWNSVVKPMDKVYHIGDFCFGRENIKIAKFLNGQKRLVLGNHDKYPTVEYLQYFLSVHGALFWNNCVLTHIPVHPGQLEHRSQYNIHGHLHSKKIQDYRWDWPVDDDRYINVSCEQNNLTPINAEVLFNGR
jgi:calcineurin-like phosphoesterase family protein